jgi:hypothetical protein
MKFSASLLLAVALAGCAHNHSSIETAKEAPSNWRSVVTADDRGRLRNWRQAWVDATAAVRKAGRGDAIAGPLFAFDVSQPDPLPPPGEYRCRVYKLAGTNPRVGAFTAYSAQPCRVAQDGPVTSFTIAGGLQRPTGLIFKDLPSRGVFLGTEMLADETLPLAYGRDNGRDLAGLVDRVGPGQWRIALPNPHFESTLDVIEIAR